MEMMDLTVYFNILNDTHLTEGALGNLGRTFYIYVKVLAPSAS
jgi:hypothetical protein